ncbi:MAG: Tol-Pal system protein TolB, partial [Pseudomonadota bacterium]
MTRPFFRFALGLLTAGLLALPASAQFRVEVSGVGLTQVPIAFAPLRGEETSPQKISTI